MDMCIQRGAFVAVWPEGSNPAATSAEPAADSLFTTPPSVAKKKVNDAEKETDAADTAHDLSITPPFKGFQTPKGGGLVGEETLVREISRAPTQVMYFLLAG